MNKISSTIYDIAWLVYDGKIQFSETQKYWKGNSARVVELLWLISWLNRIPHQHILDIGFSLSDLTYLKILIDLKTNEAVDLRAIDIVHPERVINRYPEEWIHEIRNVPFYNGDIRTFPLPDETFDTILCISTIEHIGYDQAAGDNMHSAFVRPSDSADVVMQRDDCIEHEILERLRKSLKKGGYLLLTVPAGQGGAILLKDSLGLYCAQLEYNEQNWEKISRAEGYTLVEETFFALNEDDTWSQHNQIANLKDKVAVKNSHSCGCANIILRKV